MAKLALNKSSLSREKSSLEVFERFLPSLDLKRRQLIAEQAKAARVVAEAATQARGLLERIGREIPMLANAHIPLEGVVRLESVEIGEENVLGARLPQLKAVHIHVAEYSAFARPHWVDRFVEMMREVIEIKARERIARQRLEILEIAVRKVTQRVNLFDKVLIPKTRDNIKHIQIYLSDAERAAVVRSKIAKAKRAEGGGP